MGTARSAQPPALRLAPGGAAAVDRAAAILGSFKKGDADLSLADIAHRTRLHKSTILRLIASLQHAHLMQRLDSGRYTLGFEVERLHRVYRASFSLEAIVTPVLRELVRRTGESAAYHVIQATPAGPVRLCLYRVDSPHPVRDHIQAGDVLPTDRGTGARVLQAYDRHANAGAAEADKALFAQIRTQGYLASTGDRLAEVAGISVPVFRPDGSTGASLTLTMPSHRFTRTHISPVVHAAEQLNGKIT